MLYRGKAGSDLVPPTSQFGNNERSGRQRHSAHPDTALDTNRDRTIRRPRPSWDRSDRSGIRISEGVRQGSPSAPGLIAFEFCSLFGMLSPLRTLLKVQPVSNGGR